MLKFDHNVPVPPSRGGRKTKMESDELREGFSKMKRGVSKAVEKPLIQIMVMSKGLEYGEYYD